MNRLPSMATFVSNAPTGGFRDRPSPSAAFATETRPAVRAFVCMVAGSVIAANGVSFTTTSVDLARIAREFDPITTPIELRVGLPQDARKSFGVVAGLTAVDGRLFALAEINDELLDRVRNRGCTRVSVLIELRTVAGGSQVRIKHVVFLPAEPATPAAAAAPASFASHTGTVDECTNSHYPRGTLSAALDLQTLAGVPFALAAIHAQNALSRSTTP